MNWNDYLYHYHTLRGGEYFSSGGMGCNSHLVLTQGERAPILIQFSIDSAGRSAVETLRARTMVQLNAPCKLTIRPKSLMGQGVQTVAKLVGEQDFGYPEATQGRVITTSNKPFTKLVLSDLALRTALMDRKKDSLTLRPASHGEGWHTLEVTAGTLNGDLVRDQGWISTDPVDLALTPEEEGAVLRQKVKEEFVQQMDGFLALLRAAYGAVTRWPVGSVEQKEFSVKIGDVTIFP